MPRKPRGEALGGRLWAESRAESRAESDAGRDAAVREGKRRQHEGQKKRRSREDGGDRGVAANGSRG